MGIGLNTCDFILTSLKMPNYNDSVIIKLSAILSGHYLSFVYSDYTISVITNRRRPAGFFDRESYKWRDDVEAAIPG